MKKFKPVQISPLLGTLLATTIVFGGATSASADTTTLPAIPAVPSTSLQPLTSADTLLTTFLSKSKITGGIRKNGDNLVIDPETGDAPFDFSGNIYVPAINQADGKLVATTGPVGTVAGTVIFPKAFSDLAFGFVEYLHGGPMPAIPPVIKWTLENITIVDAGTTYVPFDGTPNVGSPNVNVNPMGLDGRAFTGLGPVEVGTLLNPNNGTGMSMSVRMGGCFAVQGISGPYAGKIGTYCLNSTFTFDLSQINTANPMHSSIPGTGSSNCITVLQTPMQMPQ